MTQALSGEGIDDLWKAIEAHVVYLNESGEIEEKRREAFTHQVRQLALGRLQKRLEGELHHHARTDLDPYAAADAVLQRFTVAGDGSEEEAEPAIRPRAVVKGLT
jgi:putative protein kinase ArgK-like GTPase of G3E family